MSLRKSLLLGTTPIAAAWGWMAAASYCLLRWSGLLRLYPDAYAFPWDQWRQALPHAGRQNMPLTLWMIASALPPSFVAALLIVGLIRRSRHVEVPRLNRGFLDTSGPRLTRGVTDNHGHAHWLPFDEARRLFPGPEGTVIGEAYAPGTDPKLAGVRFNPRDRRTWGQAGKAPLLIDPCEDGATHWVNFAGPGGLKTSSAISGLLHWPWSAVVLDPANEIGPMLTRDRQQRLGHRVFQLDIATADACGFNVLDWIDIASPTAPGDVMTVLQWVAGEPPADSRDETSAFFRGQALDMQACILAHLLWSDLPAEAKTLRTFWAWLKTPEDQMRTLLKGIHASSQSAWARDLASTLMGMKADETFTGVYANATGSAKWLANPALADLVSGDSFRSADIARGRTTVFLPIEANVLSHTPGLARVIIGALLKAMYRADGDVEGRTLFLLDEVRRLGPMRMIEEARDMGRKYRAVLGLIYQSVGQMTTQWGREATDEWFNAVQHVMFSGVGSLKTAKELSDMLGSYGVMATSEGTNSGRSGKMMEAGSRSRGDNRSLHEIRRALMTASEIMTDLRADERIVVSRGGVPPIRCASPAWWRRDELVPMVDKNRFQKGKAA